MAWLHGRAYWAYVHRSDGSRVRRSLGTGDQPLAKDVERMLQHLRERREWPVLDAIIANAVSAGAVYDAWVIGPQAIEALREQLSDVDLRSFAEGWKRWALRGASPGTVAKYERQLQALIPAGRPFPASQFTRKIISASLDSLPRTGSTARRYHAAWSSFGNYLVEREVIDANPLRFVKAPKPNPARELYLDPHDAKRLVKAQPEPFRALAALREGAGVEIGAALLVRVRDVDKRTHIVHVHGTKNAWRDRRVRVEDWAWPMVLRACARKLPGALLFDGVTWASVQAAHKRALVASELDSRYRIHDSRRTYTMMRVKRGDNPVEIAYALGHRDTGMVFRVYGKYRPTEAELRVTRRRRARR